MTARPLLLRAAEILDREAKALEECHTNFAGQWVTYCPADRRAKRDYDEMVSIAQELRREAGE